MEWPILAGIPEEDVRRVLQIARRRTFGRREVVFHRGDPADTLHLVHSRTLRGADRDALGRHGDAERCSARARRSARSRCSTTPRRAAPRSWRSRRARRARSTRSISTRCGPGIRTCPTSSPPRWRCGCGGCRSCSSRPTTSRRTRACCGGVAELAGGEGGVVPLTQEELSNLAGDLAGHGQPRRCARRRRAARSSCGEAGSPCSTAPGSRHA